MRAPTRTFGRLLAIAAFFAVLPTIGCASTAAATPQLSSLRERWGVEIVGVQLASAGYMLDFRFIVHDTDKAASLFDRRIKPYVIDEASGATFFVPNPPKTGPLRSTYPPHAERRYFIFFANPGKYVKPGSRLTVVIGDFRASGLVVE